MAQTTSLLEDNILIGQRLLIFSCIIQWGTSDGILVQSLIRTLAKTITSRQNTELLLASLVKRHLNSLAIWPGCGLLPLWTIDSGFAPIRIMRQRPSKEDVPDNAKFRSWKTQVYERQKQARTTDYPKKKESLFFFFPSASGGTGGSGGTAAWAV